MTAETAPDSRAQLSRRTVVKGAAWSIPVIAVAAATPLAAASLGGADLASTLGAPADIVFDTGFGPVMTFTTPTQLTITNSGAADSVAGATVGLVYDGWLFVLTPTGTGISVSGPSGDIVITLPSITAGTSLTIDLGVALDPDAGLNDPEWVPIYAGDEDSTMTVTITGDDVTGNNLEFLILPVVNN